MVLKSGRPSKYTLTEELMTSFESIRDYVEKVCDTPKKKDSLVDRFVKELKTKIPETCARNDFREYIKNSTEGIENIIRQLWEYKHQLQSEYTSSISERTVSTTLEQLQNMWKYKQKSGTSETDLLMSGLYIFFPALRNDWINAKVIVKGERKSVYFDELTKVNKDSKLTFKVLKSNPLYSLIDYLTTIQGDCASNTVPNAKFLRLLHRSQKNVFGREYTISELRSIYVTAHTNDNVHKRKALAKQMNHNLEVSEQVYNRNQKGQ